MIEINIDWKKGPGSPQEVMLLSKAAQSKNLPGHHHFWEGTHYLMEAQNVKTARPQAERLVTAWCCFSTAMHHKEHPSMCRFLLKETVRAIQSAVPRWIEELNTPRQTQLEKAQTRKKTHDISQRAVHDFEQFREAFDVHRRDFADALNDAVFHQDWCIPLFEQQLQDWRDQLAFIEMKMNEESED